MNNVTHKPTEDSLSWIIVNTMTGYMDGYYSYESDAVALAAERGESWIAARVIGEHRPGIVVVGETIPRPGTEPTKTTDPATRRAIATLTRDIRVPGTHRIGSESYTVDVTFHQFVTRIDQDSSNEYIECLIELDDGKLDYCSVFDIRFTDYLPREAP